MTPTTESPTAALAELYLRDETAWLLTTAELLRTGRAAEIDAGTLAEYLTDMANRDRREVTSRLKVLLAHLLKWEYQPGHRSGSWRNTIDLQRDELRETLESGVLRAHAEDVLASAYQGARRMAMGETGLAIATFPADCPFTVDQLLTPSDDASA